MEKSSQEPRKAKFPAIDAHNHLWGDWSRHGEIERIMEQAGIVLYCDLTANLGLTWAGGGYQLEERDIRKFFAECPDRFYAFTTATFTQPPDQPLFTDPIGFAEKTVAVLREHVALGARGLKILKELGLHYRDGQGRLVFIDDPGLAPVWEEAARLGIPVLAHQSDPLSFFEPITPDNEHYESLKKYPTWSFADQTRFPRKQELIERRDRVIGNHPDTIFILPHVANYAEDLEYVGRLLDHHSNVYIDFSARIDEIGRHPGRARQFMIEYQDRILFGTDMPPSPAVYDAYFKFLETDYEDIVPPDYDGTFDRSRWTVSGLYLPDPVLRKIYSLNLLRLIPSLKPVFLKQRRVLS